MESLRYGLEHILYVIITTALAVVGLLLAKKYAKTEKAKSLVIKGLGVFLLASIALNRISLATIMYNDIKFLLPESFCGTTSLVLSLAMIFGKKDNAVYHFCWLLALFGAIATAVYPEFIDQHTSFFYLPTISGMLHHSVSGAAVIAIFMFGQMELSYKKWKAIIFGFTTYITYGAFLMNVMGRDDAFSIVNPVVANTPFTVWFMAPIYIVVCAIILVVVEVVRRKKAK